MEEISIFSSCCHFRSDLCIVSILDYKFSASAEAAKEVDMRLIGNSLLSVGKDGYVWPPFEVISILLLAAMIAAIVIAKKGAPKKEESQTLNK